MTKANAAKLYKHFVAVGYKSAAADLLKKYPEFEVKPEPTPKKSKK